MSQQESATIFTDGASRGNPGPSAFAYVIKRQGTSDIEVNGRLPDTTNNVAEYTALVRALEHARQLGIRQVSIAADSELMVKQVQGSYRVKNEGLRPLYEEARELLDGFDSFTIRHVPRSDNSRADKLCNQALDGDRKTSAAGAGPARNKSAGAALPDQVREEAIDCLRGVASAWARGNPSDPKPELVWDQLQSILEEAGVLRAR